MTRQEIYDLKIELTKTSALGGKYITYYSGKKRISNTRNNPELWTVTDTSKNNGYSRGVKRDFFPLNGSFAFMVELFPPDC